MKKFLVLLVVIFTIVAVFSGCSTSSDKKEAGEATVKKESSESTAKEEPTQSSTEKSSNLEESLKADDQVASLKSADGQPLLLPPEEKEIPPRPDDPEKYPQEDPRHWYDLEYAGWKTEKVNLPKSPADGAKGKKVVMIVAGDHPYWTAVGIGAKKVADAYGMKFELLNPNYDLNVQNQLIDKSINERPDMIILAPMDAKAAVQQARKINQAGIPLIIFNTVPEPEAFKYCLAWTGPDDWGQFRMLARVLADKLGKKGGVCYLQHMPGGSPYFARCWGPISELAQYAPDIKTLDMQAPGFEAEKCKQVVSDWITRFGDQLNAIVCADDSAQAIGAIEAIKKAGRTDIVVVAAGNSKVGMDAVKAGDLYAITYQSAEADGATPVKLAADWFNGKEIPPVRYLPKRIITKENVDEYMPAQW